MQDCDIITSITGPGATASNTQGGSLVTISGNNFGLDIDLQSEPGSPVTYGFTAEEHKASGCQVTVPHHQIVFREQLYQQVAVDPA